MSKFISRVFGLRKNSGKKSAIKRAKPLWFETLEDRTVPAQVITYPYNGITRITDSITLGVPADATNGTNRPIPSGYTAPSVATTGFMTGNTHVANVNVIKIDLNAPGISFKVSPGTTGVETQTQQTLAFMNQESAQLAINAHFFENTSNLNASVTTGLTGFAASLGNVYSPFDVNPLLPYALTSNAPGINISATNQAQIVNVDGTQTTLLGGVVPYNTVTGSDQIITSGVKSLPTYIGQTTPTGPHQVPTATPAGSRIYWYTDQITARSAMGLSQDNRTLYLFTVDAAGGSAGMTVSEVADYLVSTFNVYNAVNLDGGGSTTLAMKDPISGVGHVVNTQSNNTANNDTGARFVGTSLAVFANPVTRVAVTGDMQLSGTNLQLVNNTFHNWDTVSRLDAVITVGDNVYANALKTLLDNNDGKYFSEFIYPYQTSSLTNTSAGWDYVDQYPVASGTTLYSGATGAPNADSLYYSSSGSPTGENRFFPTLGNHDWGNNPTTPLTYLSYFNLPNPDGDGSLSDPGKGDERYYTFTKGPIQFFCLDSGPGGSGGAVAEYNNVASVDFNADGAAYSGGSGTPSYEPDGYSSTSLQAQWLQTQLAASTVPWKVIYFHHPAQSTSAPEAIMQWPFQQWGASAVVAGHIHSYEPAIFRNDSGGTTGNTIPYIVEGSAAGAGTASGESLIEATATSLTFKHFLNATGVAVEGTGTANAGFALTTNALPTVSITANGNANENGLVAGSFTVSRTGDTTNPLVVNLAVSGSASLGTDYTVSGATSTGVNTYAVTISAGQASATVTITPSADAIVEGTESVTLSIARSTTYPAAPTYYTDGGASISDPHRSATVTIADSNSVLIAASSSGWEYLDNGTDQGTGWRNTTGGWATGTSKFGYGGNGEVTTVGFGGNASSKFMTTYFRKSFTVGNASQVTGLHMRLQRDDGAVVYVNGTEVYRNNMPTGAITYTTPAVQNLLAGDETTWLDVNLNPSVLVNGNNVVAVEIHQSVKPTIWTLTSPTAGVSIAQNNMNSWEAADTIAASINSGADTFTFTAGSTDPKIVVSNLVTAWNNLNATAHPLFAGLTAWGNATSFQLTPRSTTSLSVSLTAVNTGGVSNTQTFDKVTSAVVKAVAGTAGSTTSDLSFDLELLSSVDTTPPATPSDPDLDATSDSGNQTDNVTNDNTPLFTGTAEVGSTVKLYLDGSGTPLVTTTATPGGTYSITATTLSDGSHTVTVTATDAGSNVSSPSGATTLTIDTIAPTADIVDVTPDPRSSPPVDSVSINFSEVIFNFDRADLTLTRNGGGNLITASQSLNSGNNQNWDFGGLDTITGALGTYVLTLSVSDIQDKAGNSLAGSALESWTVVANSPPTLHDIVDVTVNEDSGNHTINLANITPGPTADSLQTVSVSAFSSNTALIHNPSTSYTNPNTTGSLSFTPEADQVGSTTITVVVNDGQSSSNTFTRTFVITVNPVNDAPSLDQPLAIQFNEDAFNQLFASLTNITSGATNESQTLAVTATSSNTAIIPTPIVQYTSPNNTGTLVMTPAPNANTDASGPVTITVTVNDGGNANNIVTRSFTVTLDAVNDPPTLNPINPITVNEDASATTINLGGITVGPANETGTLSVSASSSNTNLVAAVNLSVSYSDPNNSGTLTFTPTAQANGSTTISVVVNDGGSSSNTITRTFVVTVNAVNDLPTLDQPVNLTINEDAPTQTVNLSNIAAGPPNESTQTLSVTAKSSNPALIPSPLVPYTQGSSTAALTFTPNHDVFGTATITVTVNDGQNANNKVVKTFVVTVSQVNRPPTLSAINAVTVNEDSGNKTLSLLGIGPGPASEGSQTVSVSASTEQTDLLTNLSASYSGTGSTGSLTFRPIDNASGTATITVTVNDGQGDHNTFTRSFVVTVNPINDHPTLTSLPDLNLGVNAGLQTVNLAGITSGAANETDTLSVSASSNNTLLIANPQVTYTSANPTGTLTFTPRPGASGSATITVTVNDGQALNNTFIRTFVVTIA